jgi:hypothetical protein
VYRAAGLIQMANHCKNGEKLHVVWSVECVGKGMTTLSVVRSMLTRQLRFALLQQLLCQFIIMQLDEKLQNQQKKIVKGERFEIDARKVVESYPKTNCISLCSICGW